jgi:hypothetical protein
VLKGYIVIDCLFFLLFIILLNVNMVVRLEGFIQQTFRTGRFIAAMTEVLIVFVPMVRLITLSEEHRPVVKFHHIMFKA